MPIRLFSFPFLFIIIIINIITIIVRDFFTSALTDGYHWNRSDSKSHQVYRTLLGILADLINAVLWSVSTRSFISKSSSSGTNLLVTVPRAPITIIITDTLMFNRFFSSSLDISMYFSLFLLSFSFTLLQSPLFGRFSWVF